MSERLVVIVDAMQDQSELLTVQEVFSHVLEIFQLVNDSDPETAGELKWRLVSANMNSPFTVVAEATASHPHVDVEPLARRQKAAFRGAYAELQRGRIPKAWSGQKTRETVKRVLARSRAGVGVTRIEDDSTSDLVITREDAESVQTAIAADHNVPRRTKTQVGSVEGKLVEVTRHYDKPAIRLIERKSGADVWCIVPEHFRHQIAESASLEDVWEGKRVVVRGAILYNTDGKISRIEASSVRRVVTTEVSDEQLSDKEFTGGLTVTEYLERLRDGTLG